MKTLTMAELRKLFLQFFSEKGHTVIPSASLIPENDPTVLFTTAGMHPLVPYLMGEAHPAGTRLTDVQKCVRTGDIDEVGDASHLTFFEMLGNWSLGDYFKHESIAWSWEFLTDEKWLGIDKDRLYFTCFEGNENAPRDTYSHDRWVEMGVDPSHIFYLGAKHNWWIPGTSGPCGPDTEIFFDTGKEKCCESCDPSCSCGKYLEIWNNVFMEYFQPVNEPLRPLAKRNVDTGMGLERTIATLQGAESVYDTDAFTNILAKISELSGKNYRDNAETIRAFRIVADHIRTSTFMLGDPRGVTPSNVDQGYILRRLIRRALRYAMQLGMPENSLGKIAEVVIEDYGNVYPELEENRKHIVMELDAEEARFQRTLTNGMREFERIKGKFENGVIDGKNAFRLFDTFGFPIEFTEEMAHENGLTVDVDGFHAAFEEHQQKSKAGAEQKFKGGLAEATDETAKLHTATHLLQAALRKVLDDTVSQKGSNITAERLRFDFSFPRKVTPEELKQVEELVQQAIDAHVDITCEEMTVPEARAKGAIGLFGDKYGERVKVYTMGDYSCEICGGPHAANTGDLGTFKIKKEEASSAGVRRIKAVLIPKE
ncbi:MAG: alanine--tRNA ligase [Christensenellales bacterium]|nr:alanine--tRNA ligase [Clostridium sp.]MDD7504129.1 alanine--tRNA ligase [Clostridium sp.]MDY2926931.1 alanine--tRNA ligase [Eubacteriales bacterium]MDY5001544.1 alanine--tRNA ligase [Eubacteriales bacterium]MDY5798816.1 alanine--tRNA ligase [Eubacteriales bacterium]